MRRRIGRCLGRNAAKAVAAGLSGNKGAANVKHLRASHLAMDHLRAVRPHSIAALRWLRQKQRLAIEKVMNRYLKLGCEQELFRAAEPRSGLALHSPHLREWLRSEEQ